MSLEPQALHAPRDGWIQRAQLRLGVQDADAHGMPVRRECSVRREEAGDDLEQERLAWTLGRVETTLPDIGGGLGEGTDHGEDRCSNLPDAYVRAGAAQSELERPVPGCACPHKLKRQRLTRTFDVREQMDVGLFCHPCRTSHGIGELGGDGRKCRRIPDAVATVISVPARGRHGPRIADALRLPARVCGRRGHVFGSARTPGEARRPRLLWSG